MLSFMRASRRLAFALLSGTSMLNQAADLAGSTAGQFAVQGGGATYSIPLSLPPGLGEMKPELSLTYNSNGGDGPLGLGWSLSGLSAVTLCPKTIAQDDAYLAASKDMAPVDQRFCLDGQRLLAVAGIHGSSNLVQRTEINTFANVTVGGWQAVPSSFLVKTKAGQKLRYGEVPSARSHDFTAAGSPAVAWFVNKISDASQNTILFNYWRPAAVAGSSPETLISSIQYTGNDRIGAEPQASVVFGYGLNSAKSYYQAAGYRMERSQRLKTITTNVRDAPVRIYKLSYGVLARTGADIIKSITECGYKDGIEHCLPPTTFAWNESNIAFWSESVGTGGSWGDQELVRTGDFNGDGLTDIASPDRSGVHVNLAKPYGGFQATDWTASNNWPSADRLLTGDFDGDGRTDFAYPNGNAVQIKYARNGFFTDSTIAPAMSPGAAAFIWGPAATSFVADMNGDGRADIVTFKDFIPTVLLKTDAGFAGSQWAVTCATLSCGPLGREAKDNFSGDINGDGITDFAAVDWYSGSASSTTGFVSYNIADPRTRTFISSYSNIPIGDARLRWLADFDGDGLSEVGMILNGSAALNVYPPSGRGIAAYTRSLVSGIADSQKDWTWCFDYNGDGRADIVTRSNNMLRVQQQSGSGFSQFDPATSITWGQRHYETHLGDFNGDGLIDIASRISGSAVSMLYSARVAGASNFNNAYASGDAAQPETIAVITSGNGARIRIDYRSFAQAEAGHTAGTSIYPNPTVAVPIWLVHEVWSTHGAGDPSQMRGTQYQYFNLRMDLHGRGVQGFESETVRDLLTGDYEITRFETAWPKTGMVLRKDSYLRDGTRLQTIEQSLMPTAQYAGVAFPYVQSSTETSYDESGNPLVITATAYSPPDSYGNFGTVSVTTRDPSSSFVSTKITRNQYLPADTASWILGRLSQTSVEHSATDVPTITKTSSFTYYGQAETHAGLLKSETIEPLAQNPADRLLTEYTYDDYGHKASVTVSGSGNDGTARAARVTLNTTVLPATGNTLQTTTTNAEGHVSVQMLSLAHGGVVSATDANGLTVSTEYDVLGRKIGQSHKVISTTWAYADAAPGEAPNAVHKITTEDSSGGSSIVFQDLLGRTVRKQTLALKGNWTYEDTRYDEQGRVVEARRPAFDAGYGAPINSSYDGRGRLKELEAPGPDGSRSITRYGYDGLTSTVTDPLGRVRTEIRNPFGRTTRIEDSGMSSVDHEYDAIGNLIRTVDAIGQATIIEYDTQGRKKAMLDPHMGRWEYRYNSFGELEWQKDAKQQITTLGYDRLGRMSWRRDPGDAQTSIWTYDQGSFAKGRPTTVQGQNGYVQTFSYNAESLPWQVRTTLRTAGVTETFTKTIAYDAQNRVSTVSHPGNFDLENFYNERGYLVALRSPIDPANQVYNEGALEARIDEILALLPMYQAAAASLSQDVLDYQTAAVELEADAASLEAATLGNASAADQKYIKDARILAATYKSQMVSARAAAADFRGDADRLYDYADFYAALESKPYTQTTHWIALLEARQAQLIEDAQHFVNAAVQYEGTAASNRAAMQTQYSNADAREQQILAPVQAQLNALLAEATQARADEASAQRELDQTNAELDRLQSQLAMLQSNTGDSTHVIWWRADEVDAEGRVTQELLGNGLLTRRTYDPATGHLLEIKTGGSTFSGSGSNDADIQDVGYDYDAADNVQYRWDHNVRINTDYSYDALDQLKTARISHPSYTALNKTLAWDYDPAGNILSRTQNGTARTYTYVDQPLTGATSRKRLSSIASIGSYGYDANGNTLNAGARTLTWSSANLPLTLGDGSDRVSYQYGPDRNRITKTETQNGQTWDTVYVDRGYERTKRTNADGSITTEFRHPLYVGDRLIGTRIRGLINGTGYRRAEYYHEDALHSVEVVTDSVG
ncbi:MAG: FG-GAP-like repeat-containing protein, partial [Panacagrimonas sp.]